ncbi:MAG: dienelactone hydrolase family protein [Candidatus Zixiibacteriota bacterium]
MKRSVVIIMGIIMAAASLQAKIQTKTVEYKQGDVVLEGYLAWDDAAVGKRPGVLVFHAWTGLGPYVKMRCEKLAAMGYIAFGADIYGKGVRPADPQEAGATSGIYSKDRPLMRARANAGLATLLAQPNVDSSRVAAIGYCFGGKCALELGRSGASIAGIVSFHGSLDTPTPADAKNIKGKVLVLHGAADPFVTADVVAGFEKEMTDANVDWQLVKYSGAVHSFTDPDAGNDPSKGAAYNASADARSWEAMKQFFAEIFK